MLQKLGQDGRLLCGGELAKLSGSNNRWAESAKPIRLPPRGIKTCEYPNLEGWTVEEVQ